MSTKKQWIIKTLLLKFTKKVDKVELLSDSFLFYKNSYLLTTTIKKFY